MVLKLLTYENNLRAQKVLIVAKYAGLNFVVVSDVDFKSEEFLKKNPTGKVPVLETENGSISEANAIVRYLAREAKPALYGKSNLDAGLIDQWIDFAATEVELPSLAWIFPIQGIIPNNPLATKKAQEDIKKVLQILDSHLITRTYIVGNTVTLADIVLATSLLELYQLVLDPTFRGPFVNVNRWFTTIVNQPEVHAVLGEVKLSEKAQVAAAPVKEKKAPKEVKPQPPKKEEKKEEKAPEAADEEEEEDYEKEDKKKKNPLDDLPKSSFILDEWKRVYSNNDTRSYALPWFFEHLDKQGYSLWRADYKYNHELSKVFMTNNLIGGFFQRLEKLHKYAFGSMNIFGEEPELAVSGVWLFRGNEIPEDMRACDDAEHYNWARLNPDDDADKKAIGDSFAWEGEFNGKKFNAGKTFK